VDKAKEKINALIKGRWSRWREAIETKTFPLLPQIQKVE
jgi:hypothetical protein